MSELTKDIKDFIFWLDDPIKCPFNHCFNGLDKDRDRICYEKGNKHYTLDQVFEIWQTTVNESNRTKNREFCIQTFHRV